MRFRQQKPVQGIKGAWAVPGPTTWPNPREGTDHASWRQPERQQLLLDPAAVAATGVDAEAERDARSHGWHVVRPGVTLGLYVDQRAQWPNPMWTLAHRDYHTGITTHWNLDWSSGMALMGAALTGKPIWEQSLPSPWGKVGSRPDE